MKGKTYLHPIIDWTEENVWEFHKIRGLKHCSLYDNGAKRVGCMFCPMAKASEREADLERYPGFTKLYIRAFERLYKKRKEQGSHSVDRWKDGEEMFYWWIKEEKRGQENLTQLFRFDD